MVLPESRCRTLTYDIPDDTATFILDFPRMSKPELADYREWFLGILPVRIRILEEAVRTTPGFECWRADETPGSLDVLGEWFTAQVETRVCTSEELTHMKEQTPSLLRSVLPIEMWDLTNCTYSLAMDGGMYLGRLMLRTHPALADTTNPINLVFDWVEANPAVQAPVYFDFITQGKDFTLVDHAVGAATYREWTADKSKYLTTIVGAQ